MESLASIRQRILDCSLLAGRTDPPLLLAVSKFQPVEKMLALHAQGQRDFGENYVQELVAKAREFRSRGITDARFHFIGKLQTNKVKVLLPEVSAVHSVDSLRLLREIAKRAGESGLLPAVYFQVNIDREESKSGFMEEELPGLCLAVRESGGVKPAGLMAIPDPGKNPADAFRRMRELSCRCGETLGPGLSMGMSGDYEEAIRHGASVIRIGTALFGERKSGFDFSNG
jgi:pyridoxal phosphate enzyme (YggS family)